MCETFIEGFDKISEKSGDCQADIGLVREYRFEQEDERSLSRAAGFSGVCDVAGSDYRVGGTMPRVCAVVEESTEL